MYSGVGHRDVRNAAEHDSWNSTLYWVILLTLLCFIALFLSRQIVQASSDADGLRAKRLSINRAIVDAGERVLEAEIEWVEAIERAGYSEVNIDFVPLYRDLLNDAIYLLNWAYGVEPNAIRINYLLGKTYSLKIGVGEGYYSKKTVNLAKTHLKKVIDLYSDKTHEISEAEYLEARNIFGKLGELHSDAFIENAFPDKYKGEE